MLPAQPNQSLIDGLACLQALAGEARPLGVTELGRRLGLETTRVHRLLRTLAHLGLVRQNAARKYEVGPAIHVLSAQSMFASGLLRRALGPLEGLQTTGHAVALGVLWRDSVSYLYHREPGMNAAEALGRVGLFPADQSSIGLVLLAAQPDEQLAGLWGGQQAEALLAELAETRLRGYGLVWERPGREVRSVAVPLGAPPYAAIALAGGIDPGEVAELVVALRAAAEAVGGAI